MRRRERISPPCKAYREDGKICGKPSIQLCPRRGCMVCLEHADPPEHPNPNWIYQVCPSCKHMTETHRSHRLLTRCPKCASPYVTPGPSKEEVGR